MVQRFIKKMLKADVPTLNDGWKKDKMLHMEWLTCKIKLKVDQFKTCFRKWQKVISIMGEFNKKTGLVSDCSHVLQKKKNGKINLNF